MSSLKSALRKAASTGAYYSYCVFNGTERWTQQDGIRYQPNPIHYITDHALTRSAAVCCTAIFSYNYIKQGLEAGSWDLFSQYMLNTFATIGFITPLSLLMGAAPMAFIYAIRDFKKDPYIDTHGRCLDVQTIPSSVRQIGFISASMGAALSGLAVSNILSKDFNTGLQLMIMEAPAIIYCFSEAYRSHSLLSGRFRIGNPPQTAQQNRAEPRGLKHPS